MTNDQAKATDSAADDADRRREVCPACRAGDHGACEGDTRGDPEVPMCDCDCHAERVIVKVQVGLDAGTRCLAYEEGRRNARLLSDAESRDFEARIRLTGHPLKAFFYATRTKTGGFALTRELAPWQEW